MGRGLWAENIFINDQMINEYFCLLTTFVISLKAISFFVKILE